MHKIKWDQAYYSLYRYPWTVDLTNAWADGSQPNAPTPTANGRRHRNGGGWVADGAQVEETAYVGLYAKVLGGKVLGNARIEDHAIVLDGTVSDNARVSGLTIIQNNTVIKDNAQVNTAFWSLGLTVPGWWYQAMLNCAGISMRKMQTCRYRAGFSMAILTTQNCVTASLALT